jgi:hypothetical protein
MLLTGLALAHGIWLYTHPDGDNERAPRYTHMVLNVAIVFYLNQRGVQEAFAPRSPRSGTSPRV